jgi:NADH-quinone oxidoreductase subunit N
LEAFLTAIEFYSFTPLVIMALIPIAIMLTIAVRRHHEVIFVTALLGFIAAFYSLFPASEYIPLQVTQLFIIDSYTFFFWGLIIAASFAVTLISYNTLHIADENSEEYYILIYIAALGSAVLVASVHFVSFFLGLEILSVSLYILISYLRKKEIAVEAGVKYLILAAASSAFLLFGMALIYFQYGTMDFYELSFVLNTSGLTAISTGGAALLLVGIGFKLAVVPFHMWTPDVYEGASSPVTAFIATISKGGAFAILLRFFSIVEGYRFYELILIFSIIAAASMFMGNWLALIQTNVKRILAYSSIAHLGYMLVAFIAGGRLAAEAVAFYLVAYFITTIGAFGIVAILSNKEREAFKIEDYKGLFWKHPLLAAAFTLMLLSLAGIPLTAGFIGKYYVLLAGVSDTLWLLVIILVVNSAIGLYYYLRIVVQMFSTEERETEKKSFSFTTGFAVVLMSLLLIYLGVYPSGLMDLIRNMVGS